MKLTINMNDEVRVRLTARGREIMRKNHAELFPSGAPVPYSEPREDDGWSTWQLWCLMQEFGRHLHNGCDVPFETEIEIGE